MRALGERRQQVLRDGDRAHARGSEGRQVARRRWAPRRNAHLDHHRVRPRREQRLDRAPGPGVPVQVLDHQRQRPPGRQLEQARDVRLRPPLQPVGGPGIPLGDHPSRAPSGLSGRDPGLWTQLDHHRPRPQAAGAHRPDRAPRRLEPDRRAALGSRAAPDRRVAAPDRGCRGQRDSLESPGRLPQPGLGQASVLDRGCDRPRQPVDDVHVGRAAADADGVRPRGQRRHRALLHPDGRGDGGHVDAVGDDRAPEPQLCAQQVAQDARAQGGGPGIVGGQDDVGGHDRPDTGRDRGPKGRQRRAQRRRVVRHHRQGPVRIDGGRAVSREVLGAGADSRGLQAGDERGDVLGHAVGAVPERSHPDHRVARVAVHVRDRGQVERHPGGGQVASERRRHGAGQVRVVDLAQGQVSGVGASPVRLQPRDLAALLVDGDDQVGASQPQLRAERGDLLPGRDVAGEQDHPAQPVLQPLAQPVGNRHAFEPGQQAAEREALQLRAHPFTAPAISPPAKWRCSSRKKTTTGIAVRVAPAISGPQSVPWLVVNPASQTVRVCSCGGLSST